MSGKGWIPRLFILWAVSCLGTFAQTPEFRGLWVDAWGAGFLSASQTTKLISDCRTYNFNAIFVQMRRRGDAFYMPQSPNLEPRTTAIASNYDALQDLITKAHTGTPRIEVHVWVTSNLIWSSVNPPPQTGHVVNRHPEYLMRNQAGENFLAEGMYLDPGHPDAMKWNYNMAMDIVRRYDIDGFHWDYIRYPQQDSGYNPVALQRFREEFNLQPTYMPAPGIVAWGNWRRRQVSDFLRWVNADLLEAKPNLVISTAVFANRSDAFTHRLQDWAQWNQDGIIDLCLPMNYSASAGVYNPRVDDAASRQGIRRVYMGQGSYLNTKENTVTQLQYARSKGLLGTLVYSYRTPNSGAVDQAGTFLHIKNNYQPTWRATPALPWKTTHGIAKGSVTSSESSLPLYNATVTLHLSQAKTQKTEVHGTYGFFNVPSGTYKITATASGLGIVTNTVTVAAGQVRDLDLVVPPIVPPEGPIRITGISHTGGQVQLQVSANANIRYELVGSIDHETWTQAATIISPTPNFTVTDPSPAGTYRFYQIRKLP